MCEPPLAHTLWISLALVLASALFGSAQQRMRAPLVSERTDRDEASTTLIGELHANSEDPPLTWSDNGDHGGQQDWAAMLPPQEVSMLHANLPVDPVEGPQLQTVPQESQTGKPAGDSGTDLRLVPLSHPSPEPSRLNGTGHYTEHWGFQEMPFQNTPNPKYYFPSPNHEEALQRLLYGIEARKGAVILTGEIGCGKTLLSRTLMDHLAEEKYDTALIADPSFEDAQLFREVLYQLGIDSAGSELDLHHRLNDRLLDNLKRGVDTVLIIDEAQCLSDALLEEVRLLGNIESPTEKLLSIILIGQPELAERLSAPSMRQLKQRVALRCTLSPLGVDEASAYIDTRIRVAGGEWTSIFTRSQTPGMTPIATVGGTSVTLGMPSGNTYYYSVIAVDARGNESPW